MINIMKNLPLYSFIFLLSACSSINASENTDTGEGDFDILLSNLLNVNQHRHTYIDEQGNKQANSLGRFKELERVYIKNIEPDLKDDKFSLKRLKTVMFFSFYADKKKSAAFQEYLATDLMPIYTHNQISFMKTLKELPFLIPSNCDRLNAFFGFEGKNDNKKQGFIEKNQNIFTKYLTNEQAKLCISKFGNQL